MYRVIYQRKMSTCVLTIFAQAGLWYTLRRVGDAADKVSHVEINRLTTSDPSTFMLQVITTIAVRVARGRASHLCPSSCKSLQIKLVSSEAEDSEGFTSFNA